MKINHLGAENCITGSCHLLQIPPGSSGPAIIIAGSGMCTGGRIVDHLEHGLEDPANDIFLWDTRQREHPEGE